jgi:putative sterol carrier protein
MNTYFTLRRLTGPTERDLGTTFQRMAELLEGSEESARVQFRILSGEKQLCWCLELAQKACQLRAERIDHPDFEIIAKAETWWQIADGSLSPLRAFTQGKMRVRGNIELGERVLMRLASSEDISERREK